MKKFISLVAFVLLFSSFSLKSSSYKNPDAVIVEAKNNSKIDMIMFFDGGGSWDCVDVAYAICGSGNYECWFGIIAICNEVYTLR